MTRRQLVDAPMKSAVSLTIFFTKSFSTDSSKSTYSAANDSLIDLLSIKHIPEIDLIIASNNQNPNICLSSDSIPSLFVEDSARVFSIPLSFIIKICIFLQNWKTSKVILVFKNDSRSEIESFRTISITILSK